MTFQLSEREAEALFAKINRPMPRDPRALHEAGVKAVAEAMARHRRIDRAAVKAVRAAIQSGITGSQ